jgi:hypothetical protein
MYGRRSCVNNLCDASQSRWLVDKLKYLGRLVTWDDNDEVAVRRNIVWAREKWVSMRCFLIVDNVDPKTKFDFLQNCGDVGAAIQKWVSLACWVLTMHMMWQLCSFDRRCCQGIIRQFIHQGEESREWICPSNFTGHCSQDLEIYMEGVRELSR